MKPQLETVFDDTNSIKTYLQQMGIDALEKKLTVACDNILDLKEELADLVAFKNTIVEVLAEKRSKC